ncbi:hypothetical protein JL107_03500 [Nakamurella flavida]|uniref:Carbohydrate kinase PfkB domain-containing protein n=1 Tax=Nakamurella flavida TaxID=363630 RepID=A0A938YIS0_9ACTN|nr:PfkB family carbohydrate kinase [Nakamurella flavida]MBM9475409.1 hypothetical protein [Nakamurella flavida]MBM9475503.1 hypothetical protein [Nakamurella flavida]MDP9776989.1 sugar/nucleoside kinase (ribokinase family) [Nakamurella flavida]
MTSTTGLAVAGHICLDLTPTLPGPARVEPGQLVDIGALRMSLGGSAANTGRALADLGRQVDVVAGVGDDPLGAVVAAEVEAYPGLHGRIQVIPGSTTSYSVVVEPPGTDRTFWHHTGANALFDGAALDPAGLDLLHVGYPPLLPAMAAADGAALVDLFTRARAAGATTSLDLAVVDRDSAVGRIDWTAVLRACLPHTDVISPSVDDLTSALGLDAPTDDAAAAALAADLAGRLLAWGAAVVVLSDGGRGLLVRTAGRERLAAGGRVLAPMADTWADADFRILPVPVADPRTTNGAGDACTAGLLAGLVAGGTPRQAVTLAAATAAVVISGRRPTPDVVLAGNPELAGLFATRP